MQFIYNILEQLFKFLMEEIEEDIRRWKDHPCSWISIINIVKILHLNKKQYSDSIHSLLKSQDYLFQTLKEQLSASHGKAKTQDIENNSVHKRTYGGINTTPDVKLY